MTSIACVLIRVEGSPDDKCERFLKCFYDRVFDGPPEYGKEGRADEREVDISLTRQDFVLHGDITEQSVRQSLEDAAEACDPDWRDLYALSSGE